MTDDSVTRALAAADAGYARAAGLIEVARIEALVNDYFVPDFCGVDWSGGDETVQEFVAALTRLLRDAANTT